MTFDVASLTVRGTRLGKARNATKADVWLVKDGGRDLVVKTTAGRPAVARLLAGFLVRREGRVLATLRGVPGVPQLVEATRDALVVERLPGETLHQLRRRGIDEETGRRVAALVAALHARGVAHGDIGRHDVLVDADGSVSLVDFATAVGPGFPPLVGRLLFPLLKRHDAKRVAKLVRRYRCRWDERTSARAARAT
jgi:RIO-like serine/threonine protein kinase